MEFLNWLLKCEYTWMSYVTINTSDFIKDNKRCFLPSVMYYNKTRNKAELYMPIWDVDNRSWHGGWWGGGGWEERTHLLILQFFWNILFLSPHVISDWYQTFSHKRLCILKVDFSKSYKFTEKPLTVLCTNGCISKSGWSKNLMLVSN